MCGIIGYYGLKNTKKILLEGLKTLEYRGYDSAGVSIWHKDSFQCIRAKGNLNQLNKKLKSLALEGPLGIGHIRWATHGKPSETNAHPHTVQEISIVHNGIIENDLDLRAKLTQKKVSFQSETDSELLAHLISREFLKQKKTKKKLLNSVLKTIPKLKGHYSVLVISGDYPKEIIAFKKGLPLILGQNKNLVMVASDVKALLPHTQNMLYLKDHQVIQIQGLNFKIFDPYGKEIQKLNQQKIKIHDIPEKLEKSGFEYFMLKEIFEQPEKMKKLLNSNFSKPFKKINFKSLKTKRNPFSKVKKIFIVACGSSFYASLIGKHLFEKYLRIPTEAEIASEFRYQNPLLTKDSLVLLISQSGETADTLAALSLMKQKKIKTLGICNEKNSSLAREVDDCLYLEAGTERAVASTKSFTNTLILFYLLSLKFKSNQSTHWIQKNKEKKESHKLSKTPTYNQNTLFEWTEEKLIRALKKLASQMKELSQKCETFFLKNINFFTTKKGFFFIGRGPHYPIALEGALKMKELAYKQAEGYPAGELKHGPLALIDPSMLTIVLCPKDSYYEKTLNNLIEIKTRKGKILAIGTQKDEEIQKLSDHFIPLPKVNPAFYPLLEIIPLQLLAYSVAKSLGYDVDHPRNLAKSVTVE